MALMKCPGCENEVSDKAIICPKCGYILKEEPKEIIVCEECGNILSEVDSVCPKCGCPVENEKPSTNVANPQQVEVTGIKVSKNNKKKMGIIVGIVLIAILAVFGIQQSEKKKAAEEAERLKQEYVSNLQLITYSMLSGAGEAESCGNLIKKVWYNAIYEEYDSETNEYTRPNGYFVSDFNDALGNLFADSDFQSKITSIESNQATVKSLMKEMQNPPVEYNDAYDALNELYDAYIEFTNLVTNPTGSLTTFSSDFNDADSKTVNCYEAMDLYIGD